MELNGPEGTQPQLLDRLRVLRVALSHAGRDVVKLSLSDRRAWSFELDDGLTVMVGRKDFGDRVRRFARVFPTALSSRIADIDRVDLRYTNGFAVRWKHANPKTQG
jgi:cell division protein FtsQ